MEYSSQTPGYEEAGGSVGRAIKQQFPTLAEFSAAAKFKRAATIQDIRLAGLLVGLASPQLAAPAPLSQDAEDYARREREAVRSRDKERSALFDKLAAEIKLTGSSAAQARRGLNRLARFGKKVTFP